MRGSGRAGCVRRPPDDHLHTGIVHLFCEIRVQAQFLELGPVTGVVRAAAPGRAGERQDDVALQEMARTSSKFSTNGFPLSFSNMNALVIDPPFETMPRIRSFFRNSASIAGLTQCTTKELIPCSACFRIVARM